MKNKWKIIFKEFQLCKYSTLCKCILDITQLSYQRILFKSICELNRYNVAAEAYISLNLSKDKYKSNCFLLFYALNVLNIRDQKEVKLSDFASKKEI